MFLTKKARESIVEEAIERINVANRLKKWVEFYYADKVGYIIKYDGLEWECISSTSLACSYNARTVLSLMVGGQLKQIRITLNTPEEMSFVYE